jgi:hypothetical protein
MDISMSTEDVTVNTVGDRQGEECMQLADVVLVHTVS